MVALLTIFGLVQKLKSQKYQKPKAKARKTETPNNVIFIPITIAGGFGSETRNGPSQRTPERLRCSS